MIQPRMSTDLSGNGQSHFVSAKHWAEVNGKYYLQCPPPGDSPQPLCCWMRLWGNLLPPPVFYPLAFVFVFVVVVLLLNKPHDY